MKLFVLTDTRVVFNKNKYYIFNAVKYELEAIQSLFNEISILGVYYKLVKENNSVEQCKENWEVSSIVFPARESIIFLIFFMFKLIIFSFRKIAKSDVIHVRGPGIPLLVGLFYCIIFPRKKWWFKYANDWSSWGKSRFWDFQKRLLMKIPWIKVTINGKWPNQPKHVLSFENPSIWEVCSIYSKGYDLNHIGVRRKLSFIFVGRLTEEKGILLALTVLERISKELASSFDFKLTVIGNGPLSNKLTSHKSKMSNFEFVFLGSMAKTKIFEYYKCHDFIVLPTISPEGFPKVIAEGMAYGCIPIVSAVSSIPQYIRHFENGVLLSELDIEHDLYNSIRKLCYTERKKLVELKINASELSKVYFTYKRFFENVKRFVIG